MPSLRPTVVAASLLAAALAPSALALPSTAQDFEDGTTQGWSAGGGPGQGLPPIPPAVLAGGPAGADDDYLRITAVGGFGPGSRLTAHNASAWSGNFAAAGLDTITMDLRNFGAGDLFVRLVLEDFSNLGNVRIATTTAAVFLPAGGDWTSGVFSLAAADLTALEGDVAPLLASVQRLRIFGSDDPNQLFRPLAPTQTSSAAVLGIDNITPNVFGTPGNGVPEPSGIWLAAAGLLAGLAMTRSRRRRWECGRPSPAWQ